MKKFSSRGKEIAVRHLAAILITRCKIIRNIYKIIGKFFRNEILKNCTDTEK